GPGEFGEAALHHRHLQLVDVGEVPVDRRGGDPDPPGHPAQRQRAVVAGLADHLAGLGDDLLPQPIALTAPVPPPGRGQCRLDGRRHHATCPSWRALAAGWLVMASPASTAPGSTEGGPPAGRSPSPARPPRPPSAPHPATHPAGPPPAA